ncbi:MAG: NACHT domain-containing protein [Symploca sp. SIO1C2]|nr:NACHT domain-containing protein [Symploca sp. SIO1C2]
MPDWSNYLQSICTDTDYVRWWKVYTLTEVVGKEQQQQENMPLLFDFKLMVQTVEREEEKRDRENKEEKERIERLGVLEGLRKYAEEHVLLVGKPGSGKSTALKRLLLENSEIRRRGEGNKGRKIPVLVELRYYRTSILDLIQDFLQRHQPELEVNGSILKNWLREGQLLLLVDGLNELPSPTARQDLSSFRRNYQKTTPMVFTTRDLGVGGDLDITKKLEMQPLSEKQMQQFVHKYLPQKGEQMLRQLGSRLREFGETPLLLMMLCSVFAQNDNKVPANLGSVFRQFTQIYSRKHKQDAVVSEDSRRWWKPMLEKLAWVMTCGEGKTQLQVAIPKEQGEAVLIEFLQGKVAHPENCALGWLDGLLKHHLIQLRAGELIEFPHQLLQEYYTAEYLLKLLTSCPKPLPQGYRVYTNPNPLIYTSRQSSPLNPPILGDFDSGLPQNWGLGGKMQHSEIEQQMYVDGSFSREGGLGISDEELKREYLNYLKWTEPLALMLELVENEAQAVGVVKLALEVDWRLGARLAGAVKPKFQEQTVGLVTGLEIPQLLKIRLLGITKSESAVPLLIKALQDQEDYVRRNAAYALGKIRTEATILALIQSLQDQDYDVRRNAAQALGRVGTEAAIPALIQSLQDEHYDVRRNAAQALGRVGTEAAIPALIQSLQDENGFVRRNAAQALGRVGTEAAIPALIQSLQDEDDFVRRNAAQALGRVGTEEAIPALIQSLQDEHYYVRSYAAQALERIGTEAAIITLIQFLQDEPYHIRGNAAEALGKFRTEAAIPVLIQSLQNEDSFVSRNAAVALGEIGTEAAIPALIQSLQNEDSFVSRNAAVALGKIGTEAAILALIQSLQDEDDFVRSSAAFALGKIGTEAAISDLIESLQDEDSYVRRNAAEALGKIGTEAAIPALIQALQDKEYDVRRNAAVALGEIGTGAAISALIQSLQDKEYDVRRNVAQALDKIGTGAAINQLVQALKQENFVTANRGFTLNYAIRTLEQIQQRYQLYNPTLIQPIPTPEPQPYIPSTQQMYILHLSDLHITTPNQATLWSNQLAEDLRNELDIPQLDALILSGDIANYSTPEEYQAAEQFLHNLRQDFPLEPEQIIIVPGNHDLNWKQAKKAYQLVDLEDYEGELQEGHYIKVDDTVVRVRDETAYKQRFINFSKFYQAIVNQPYPQEYDQQGILYHLPQQNLLFLGLNSAWQLDHHYKSRASINMNTLSNALTEIRRNRDYDNCLKIAVWHHPLTSAYEDRIADTAFLDQLAVAGFRFFLHGHIHEAKTSNYRYDMSQDGRNLDQICAGTFGAPTQELVTATPWQYNLLQFEPDQLTVRTRRRTKENGAWEADSIWRQGKGTASLDYYTIQINNG